jgi:hypothetical protein
LESIANVERNKLKDLLPKVICFLYYYGWKYGWCEYWTRVFFFRSCINGNIISKFISIGEPESTSSDDLYKFVNEELESFGFKDHMKKLIGFGSDGASNMTGQKRGMVTQLKMITL